MNNSQEDHQELQEEEHMNNSQEEDHLDIQVEGTQAACLEAYLVAYLVAYLEAYLVACHQVVVRMIQTLVLREIHLEEDIHLVEIHLEEIHLEEIRLEEIHLEEIRQVAYLEACHQVVVLMNQDRDQAQTQFWVFLVQQSSPFQNQRQ